MGTNNRIEHSIQNAYLKAIQLRSVVLSSRVIWLIISFLPVYSEHFVYIENQFFITSTVVDGIVIENQIGDALVNRIIQAHEEGTPWRACIVIPLLPGYTYPVDSDQASSVRCLLAQARHSL
jgi:phospholipase D1/2